MPRYDLAELGTSGLLTYAGIPYDSVVLKLQGPERNAKLRAMIETDDVVGGVLSTFEQLGRSVKWWVDAGTDKSGEQKKRADWVQGALDDMETPFQDVLSEAYTFLGYGFAPLEVVRKIRRGPNEKDPRYRSKFRDNKVAWRKMSLRAQTSVDRWEFGPGGDILAMTQLILGDEAQYAATHRRIPIERLLLFRTSAEKNNPEGRPIVRNAWRTWFRKHMLEDVEAVGAENDMVGVPFIQGPETITSFNPSDSQSQAEIAQALNIITAMRTGRAQGMFIPHGWGEPKLIAAPGQRTFDSDKLMKRYDSRMAISMLAGFVLTGMDKHGSFALSGNQLDVIIVAVNGYNDRIADQFNRKAVPQILADNGWDATDPPQLNHGEPDFSTVEQTLQTVQVLAGMGSEVPLLGELQRQLLGRVGLEVEEKAFEEAIESQEKKDDDEGDQPPFPANLRPKKKMNGEDKDQPPLPFEAEAEGEEVAEA